jgi:thiamine biosynthesis protein ThiI
MTALPATALTEAAATHSREPCVLLKLGEIVLKGRNRQQFEKMLQNNIWPSPTLVTASASGSATA